MPKRKRDESWLTSEAKQAFKPEWQDRVLKILQDISTLPHLKFTCVIGKDGSRFTRSVSPNASHAIDESYSTLSYSKFANIIDEYVNNLGYSSSSQVTIELEDEILVIAPCGELYLIASFFHGIPRGYMSMKLTKRISHMRSMWQGEPFEMRASN